MLRWKTDVLTRGRRLIMTVATAVVLSLAGLSAQGQDGFVKLADPTAITKENLPASPLLYTAYGLVWLVLIGYIFLLWRRVGRVEQELRDVSARLGAAKR